MMPRQHFALKTLLISLITVKRPSLLASLNRVLIAWLPAFCVVQMLGISGAVAAAVIEIESILGTGPTFSLFGLALAVRGRRSQSTVFFGLSTGVVSIAVFFLIYLRRWSPDDARYPVPLALIAYEYLISPVALLAVYRLRQGSRTREPGRGVIQFGLRHLLLLTTYFAVVFAALRLAMTGHPLPVAIAPGLVVMLAVLVSWHRYSGSR